MRRAITILTTLAFCVVALFGFAATSPAASGTGSGWAVTAETLPTALAPGGPGIIEISPSDIGADPTQGQIVVIDRLPDGVTAAGYAKEAAGGAAWDCHGNAGAPGEDLLEGASVVTCVNDPAELPSFAGGYGLKSRGMDAPPALYESPSIAIEVRAPQSEGVYQNEVSVTSQEASPAAVRDPLRVSSLPTSFQIGDLDTWFSNADGAFDLQAGSHPYEWTTNLGLSTELLNPAELGESALVNAGGQLRNVFVELPPGLIGNPQSVPTCTTQQFVEQACPLASVIGRAVVPFTAGPPAVLAGGTASLGAAQQPVFNLLPARGSPAEIGFNLNGINEHLLPSLRTGTDYGLDVAAPNAPARGVTDVALTIWGTPAEESHDRWRLINGESGELDPRIETPYLTMPTSCGAPPLLRVRATTWGADSHSASAEVEMHDAEGDPVGLDGCNREPFGPAITARPSTDATDSPSGLEVDLHMPDSGLEENTAETSEADLKDATVTLPQGMVVNPAGANGLGACSPAQIGLTSEIGQTPVTMTPGPANCPEDSKVGTVEVDSPLLDHPIGSPHGPEGDVGAVYLATPRQNPFGSLLAIYIAVDDPQTGTVLKLAGKVDADPVTGRLTTTVAENPQLPFEDFRLDFFGGAGAALRTPQLCGAYETTSDLAPWSTPEGADAHPSDSFPLTQSPGGGSCPTSQSQLPNIPSLEAGTVAPKAGVYSPFVLHLARADGTQELSKIETTLPEGLLAKLAGVSECPDAAIAQAESRDKIGEGAAEIAHPSCPASSEVGIVHVGAGAGPSPYYVSGHAYLAGPYKGAPLSFEFITSAVAGPYDLGTVALRAALHIDPLTSQATAVSDPLPHILQGIPLDVRSIAVELNRGQFTLNPTNCSKKSITGAVGSVLGASSVLNVPFQVGECSVLGFKPKLALKLKGGTRRHTFPALTATVTYPKGSYANIAKVQVTLPHSEFLEQSHIGTVCTRVQFAAGAGDGEQCPPASVYGFAKATSPLLDNPVEGPVYLRSSSNPLPDLVAALNGQIDVDLDGKVDTGKGGGIRNTFEAVPDAPVSKFTLSLFGGKKGLLVNSENLCSKHAKTKAIADFTGQNGKVYDTNPVVVNSCKKKGKGRKGKHHKASKRQVDRVQLSRLLGGW